MTVSPLLAAPQAAAGKLKILAQTGPTRVPMIADVPTAVEAGFKDLVVVAWFGLAGPANLPPAVTAKLVERARDIPRRPVRQPALCGRRDRNRRDACRRILGLHHVGAGEMA